MTHKHGSPVIVEEQSEAGTEVGRLPSRVRLLTRLLLVLEIALGLATVLLMGFGDWNPGAGLSYEVVAFWCLAALCLLEVTRHWLVRRALALSLDRTRVVSLLVGAAASCLWTVILVLG